jgi:DNA-binding CsgD family transcriptional regulator
MELIERGEFLKCLDDIFYKVKNHEGHCVLISGETGIGKTSLVKNFCSDKKGIHPVYVGSCDALFTPRPLAPLLDILLQLDIKVDKRVKDVGWRAGLFTAFLESMREQTQPPIVIIEDIHWADEATLDFITFFGRRVSQFQCMFILTFRDNEVHLNHPLGSVLGQLLSDSASRIQLTSLSRLTVEELAIKRGYKGEDIYTISGGNPFYVSEILAGYPSGVPASIKDSILSSYNRLDEKTKQLWQVLSVTPNGFELAYLERMDSGFRQAIHNGLHIGVLVLVDRKIWFKHELFRRTVETSLSPLTRMSLNKQILDLYKEVFEEKNELERIIHHAINAGDSNTVLKYAPMAARHAAAVGAHTEACKLYRMSIEYYSGDSRELLIELYEACAYECYLINQVKDAIFYQQKALAIRLEKSDLQKTANCSRFLSRLWWFDGNRLEAEAYANKAVDMLAFEPPSAAKSLAFSNMAQLKVFSEEMRDCLEWGTKAVEMALELDDQEVLCHAMISVGSAKWKMRGMTDDGIKMIEESLGISLINSYQEQAARAYSNLIYYGVQTKDYELAKKYLEESINYCEERDLDSSKNIKLYLKARLLLEGGDWKEADVIARHLLANADQAGTIKIGALLIVSSIEIWKGETGALARLTEAKRLAFGTREHQRIIPTINTCLQYEWVTGTRIISDDEMKWSLILARGVVNEYINSEFVFWYNKARHENLSIANLYEPYDLLKQGKVNSAAQFWEAKGCPFDKALALLNGTYENKKSALTILQYLGAHAVYAKVKDEMRHLGSKGIPRGVHESTKRNPAFLTKRELDVLQLLKKGIQNKEIADILYISAKTVDNHISSIFFKLNVNSRLKAVQEAAKLDI